MPHWGIHQRVTDRAQVYVRKSERVRLLRVRRLWRHGRTRRAASRLAGVATGSVCRERVRAASAERLRARFSSLPNMGRLMIYWATGTVLRRGVRSQERRPTRPLMSPPDRESFGERSRRGRRVFRGKAITIACTDRDRSAAFYQHVLGAVPLPSGDGYGCPWYSLGAIVFSLMPNAGGPSPASFPTDAMAMLLLEVDDLAAAHRHLADAGVRIVEAPGGRPVPVDRRPRRVDDRGLAER